MLKYIGVLCKNTTPKKILLVAVGLAAMVGMIIGIYFEANVFESEEKVDKEQPM